jgi:AAA15 family ATPase/GTPase
MKYIDNIEIKNFKSIKHQFIDGCRRLNIFIGYPNVGKSNLLEAISMFSISAKTKKFNDFVRIENNTSLFHDGNISDSSEVTINGNYRIESIFKDDRLSILTQYDARHKKFQDSDEGRKLERVKYFSVLESDKSIIEYSADGQGVAIEGEIEILKYDFNEKVVYDAQKSKKLQHPFGENIFEILSNDSKLRGAVADLFDSYNLEFVSDRSSRTFRILKRIEGDIFSIPYSMIADTLQRVIFYKVAICSNSNSVLLFEEPEAHMFPPYIRKFTYDLSSNKSNQVFLATHSPYVLESLIEESFDDLSIYLVDYIRGESIVRRLTDLEMNEKVTNGIDLFFNIENYLDHGQTNNA